MNTCTHLGYRIIMRSPARRARVVRPNLHAHTLERLDVVCCITQLPCSIKHFVRTHHQPFFYSDPNNFPLVLSLNVGRSHYRTPWPLHSLRVYGTATRSSDQLKWFSVRIIIHVASLRSASAASQPAAHISDTIWCTLAFRLRVQERTHLPHHSRGRTRSSSI